MACGSGMPANEPLGCACACHSTKLGPVGDALAAASPSVLNALLVCLPVVNATVSRTAANALDALLTSPHAAVGKALAEARPSVLSVLSASLGDADERVRAGAARAVGIMAGCSHAEVRAALRAVVSTFAPLMAECHSRASSLTRLDVSMEILTLTTLEDSG